MTFNVSSTLVVEVCCCRRVTFPASCGQNLLPLHTTNLLQWWHSNTSFSMISVIMVDKWEDQRKVQTPPCQVVVMGLLAPHPRLV